MAIKRFPVNGLLATVLLAGSVGVFHSAVAAATAPEVSAEEQAKKDKAAKDAAITAATLEATAAKAAADEKAAAVKTAEAEAALAKAAADKAGDAAEKAKAASTPDDAEAAADEAAAARKEAAEKPEAAAVKYAGDDGRYDGDHLRLNTNAEGFISTDAEDKTARCATVGSTLAVLKEDADNLIVTFVSVPDKDDGLEFPPFKTPPEAFETCQKGRRVNEFTQYRIAKSKMQGYDVRRSGIVFGGLVVPFKFYLGGGHKILPSTTIAPFVGYARSGPLGTTVTPIFSAGMGMVPVSDGMDSTTTKAALSIAGGFVISSPKNAAFNAGALIGKDFLSRADRQSDPTVNQIWISFYVGYAM